MMSSVALLNLVVLSSGWVIRACSHRCLQNGKIQGSLASRQPPRDQTLILMMTWTQRFAPLTRGFHAYARWLVGISWKKFFLLAVLLMICASLLQSLPPFSWLVSEQVSDHVSVKRVEKVRVPRIERSDSPIRIELHTHVAATERGDGRGDGQIRVEIRRDNQRTIEIKLPASSDTTDALGSVAREIQKAIVEANTPSSSSVPTAKRPAGSNANASNPSASSASKKPGEPGGAEPDDDGDASDEDEERGAVSRIRVHTHSGEPLTDFAFLWIVASIIIKIAYTFRLYTSDAADEQRGLDPCDPRTRQKKKD